MNNLQNKVVFIDILGFSSTEQIIRNTARDHGTLIRLDLGSHPQTKTKKNVYWFFGLIKSPIEFIKKLISFIKYKAETARAKKYFPDYIVVSGSKSISNVNNKKTSIIKAHNFDYDNFILEKQIKINKKSKFLVFLDEDGPYHSDFIKLGIKPYVTGENYYPLVDLSLDVISKSLKLNVKIAAHPRSNYANKKIKYSHPIFKNKTFELIKEAELVVAHSSTTLQLAVIMKKPIIIVTTDEIQNQFHAKSYAQLIENYAKLLGKKIINLNHLSEINDFSDYLNIDNEKYENFIDTYVKTKGSPEKLVWDIVIKHIESDLYV